MNEQKPPVSVGEEFKVKVEAVGEKGDGIVKVKGFVLFVPGVREGQNIKIKVNKVLSKVGFAEKVGEVTKEEVKVDVIEEIPAVDDEPSPEDSENFGEETEENDDLTEEAEEKNEKEELKEESEGTDEIVELPKDE